MAPRDLDYIMDEITGGGGWWQWKKALWLIPQYISSGLPLLLHMFAAYTPPHRCFVPGCDDPVDPRFRDPGFDLGVALPPSGGGREGDGFLK